MGVSKNNGTPKSSILIVFSIINHPFWGTPIFGNIHIHQTGDDFEKRLGFLHDRSIGDGAPNLRGNVGLAFSSKPKRKKWGEFFF